MNEKILAIKSATYINEYKISIIFKDNTERIIDFKFFLQKSTTPDISKYLELDKFKTFTVNNGQLMWGDYDLIFPINDLYSGNLFHQT